ncbi:MAG: M28 family peptidase [bacterium]|nr:M28 family peptidase [bacterium]
MEEIYQDVCYLSEELGHRLTSSENEAKAFDFIRKRLEASGLAVEGEQFKVPSSVYALYQFLFLAGLLASLTFHLFQDQFKLLLILFGAFLLFLFYKEFVFQHTFFYTFLKSRWSQNLASRISPASGQVKRQVYVVAHVDSARAGLLFHPRIVRCLPFFIRMSFVAFGLLFLNSLVFLIIPHFAGRLLFYALDIFFTACLAAAFHSEYAAPPCSGANDNASGAGVLLALMAYFKAHPLDHVEVTGLFTGAEETGCDGIHHYLRKHQFELRPDAGFLVLECCGIGNPVFLRSEGMLKKYLPDSEMNAVAEKASLGLSAPAEGVDLPVGYTEMEVIRNFGFKALSIGAAPADKNAVPNWHQKRDKIIYIQKEALGNVFDFAKNIILTIDQA